MTEYGMGDDATINEVLDDVDTDKVGISFLHAPRISYMISI